MENKFSRNLLSLLARMSLNGTLRDFCHHCPFVHESLWDRGPVNTYGNTRTGKFAAGPLVFLSLSWTGPLIILNCSYFAVGFWRGHWWFCSTTIGVMDFIQFIPVFFIVGIPVSWLKSNFGPNVFQLEISMGHRHGVLDIYLERHGHR